MKTEDKYALFAMVGDNEEVIRIEYDGKTFWRGREIDTDDDFRKAMIDLSNAMQMLNKSNGDCYTSGYNDGFSDGFLKGIAGTDNKTSPQKMMDESCYKITTEDLIPSLSIISKTDK